MRSLLASDTAAKLWSWLRMLLALALLALVVKFFATYLPKQQSLTPTVVLGSVKTVGGFVALIAAFVVALEFVLYVILMKLLKWKHALAYMLVAPGMVGIALLFLYPFSYNIAIAFSDRSLQRFLPGAYSYGLAYGLENFKSVFTDKILHDTGFWEVFARTWLWTAINVFFHVLGGLGLALLLNRNLPLRGLYRTILVFPWAIPQVIVALALRNEFHYQYGFVNNLLVSFGLPRVEWLSEPVPAFAAVTISNIWLGIPFMMVIILGGLQSISHEFYEAAAIDGASGWQQFQSITWPLLQPVLTPATVMGTIWTFNAFNVIYLITVGGPSEKTDILVTALFKAAFEFYRYGQGAAFALVIFVILFAVSATWIQLSGGLKGVTD